MCWIRAFACLGWKTTASQSACVCVLESERYQSSSAQTCTDILFIPLLCSHLVSYCNVLSPAGWRNLSSVSECDLLCVLVQKVPWPPHSVYLEHHQDNKYGCSFTSFNFLLWGANRRGYGHFLTVPERRWSLTAWEGGRITVRLPW